MIITTNYTRKHIKASYTVQMKAELIKFLERKITGCDELEDMQGEKWAFQQCLKFVREQLEPENTLNRDKVMDIIDGPKNGFAYSIYPNEVNELVDALCSLSLPTLSDGEVEGLFSEHSSTKTISGLMRMKGFKAALKELTKPKDER